jgi:hypothetical protein
LAFFQFLYVKNIEYPNCDIKFVIYAKFWVKIISLLLILNTLNKLEPIYAMKLLDLIGFYSSFRDMNTRVNLSIFIDRITDEFNKILDGSFWY